MADDAVKPVVLAVDDDSNVLRAIRRDLRDAYSDRFRILGAPSADEALTLLDALEKRNQDPALFLVDQRMPKMTGVEFLEEAVSRFPDARRVLLTAYADTNAAITAINRIRLDYYLMKPWDPPTEHLFPVLDDLLADWLAGHQPPYQGIRVIGHQVSSRTHAVRDFLTRNGRPFQFLNVETEPDARELAEAHAGTELPLVAFPDGRVLGAPDTSALADGLGLSMIASRPHYDTVIVGAGPSGLAAGVYSASEGLSTLIVDSNAPGGQAGTSSLIENYLGFPGGLSGADLARRAVAQATRFGAELLSPVDVTALRDTGPAKILTLSDGTELSAQTVLLAMGVHYNRLTVPGAEEFESRGLYYGAATTEASSCARQQVFIVGGANSAGQAAVHFSRFAARVTVLIRSDAIENGMSQYLVDEIHRIPNISVQVNTQVLGIAGDQVLRRIQLRDSVSGEEREEPATVVFTFIGARPRTDWLADTVSCDERGFVLTGSELLRLATPPTNWPLERAPLLLETSLPGTFAAGDVRAGSIKRVASGVGEGAMAVALMHQYRASH